MTQPGYDVLAGEYAATFPSAFRSELERHAVDCFADLVLAACPGTPFVIDIGCGPGHTADHLRDRGMTVVGLDRSAPMLDIARARYPGIRFLQDDADATSAPIEQCTGLIAQFSLIHVEPASIPGVLASWRRRMVPGTIVLIAMQGSDEAGIHEFDHVVARAWRWHPDALSSVLSDNGFDETLRMIRRPDQNYRFPEVYLMARLLTRAGLPHAGRRRPA
ncbi:methyltransferase domain-containing protein [Gordonia sp. SID5947]|uniref:class I SAM-dependent DNA methyltransferase n=1 Tax=Gordonia sp. SID5947 TaxID=2690315 RepID=UPI00137053F0|nr:class I SAM-dependent methyltransferase [Gordonia sp. SID5947]MYR06096.1 methyltransferase domain-containing protein [Gordonia sp. SID5947]